MIEEIEAHVAAGLDAIKKELAEIAKPDYRVEPIKQDILCAVEIAMRHVMEFVHRAKQASLDPCTAMLGAVAAAEDVPPVVEPSAPVAEAAPAPSVEVVPSPAADPPPAA